MLWGAYYLLVTYVRCQASGFSKGVLEIPEDEKRFQKMKRDKGENKKPGFFFFFKFPTALIWCSQDQGGQPESSICCIHLHHWCHCDNRPVRAERVRQKCAHTTLKPSQERRFSPHWLGANPKEPLSSHAWTQPKPGPRTLTPTHMLDHLGFLP